MTSYFRIDTVDVYAKDVLLQVPKEPFKTCLIFYTKEVKATKKVKKKKWPSEKVKKEWKIKSVMKGINFKNFSSSFRVSNEDPTLGGGLFFDPSSLNEDPTLGSS